jgi:uncharacterized protein YcnI
MRRLIGFTTGVLLLASTAQAHVTVWPRESLAGATEKYVVRVPTEGKVTTTSVDLEIPDGVTVYLVGAPGEWTYEVKRQGDRIVAITWKQDIKPGEFAEFPFIARNPSGARIAWKARQNLADGTHLDFTGGPGDRSPSPVTRLKPGSP